jgi:hypothetical protein
VSFACIGFDVRVPYGPSADREVRERIREMSNFFEQNEAEHGRI